MANGQVWSTMNKNVLLLPHICAHHKVHLLLQFRPMVQARIPNALRSCHHLRPRFLGKWLPWSRLARVAMVATAMLALLLAGSCFSPGAVRMFRLVLRLYPDDAAREIGSHQRLVIELSMPRLGLR